MPDDIYWHAAKVSREMRERLAGHRGLCLWLTGMSGAGKSTLANAVEYRLYEMGVRTYLLDGDNIRHGLSRDLGFSERDRAENVRRVAEVARLFVDAGVVVLTALISPYRADREAARALFAPGRFIEVYVRCPLPVCEQRDPKGLYKKARAGLIPNFTGISAPYEPPAHPELVVDTAAWDIGKCVDVVVADLVRRLALADASPPGESAQEEVQADGQGRAR
ncbi:putative adenylyl-sulfate kinase [Alicyclobacillus cellulosilyticus]|uniref:Adenylyl-sulfate kinase n=1 Tax=Alicyclobacillus cellulosilyticus TaxID=1003997 RepID=A0A917K2T8_9BACL|nr:adenylyl-sulfate kinase [Alicyclobacillus cellulosilyticus]GGI97889.1 putative adenylyl-sulfate kinase [Alicyclobacillus cellulosilyticus]